MPSLQEARLPDNAIEYIRAELATGSTYARQLSQLPLDKGHVTTFLPPQLDPSALPDFSAGPSMIFGVSMEGNRTMVSQAIRDYLAEGAYRIAIVETAHRENDSSLASRPINFFTHGEEVYFWIAREGAHLPLIQRVMSRARDYPFVCGLSLWPAYELQELEPRKLEPNELSLLAKNTKHIVVGAFDMEGYVIWHGPGLAS